MTPSSPAPPRPAARRRPARYNRRRTAHIREPGLPGPDTRPGAGSWRRRATEDGRYIRPAPHAVPWRPRRPAPRGSGHSARRGRSGRPPPQRGAQPGRSRPAPPPAPVAPDAGTPAPPPSPAGAGRRSALSDRSGPESGARPHASAGWTAPAHPVTGARPAWSRRGRSSARRCWRSARRPADAPERPPPQAPAVPLTRPCWRSRRASRDRRSASARTG
ncbi:hypothetical protein D3C72_1645910 [compost metagenome]